MHKSGNYLNKSKSKAKNAAGRPHYTFVVYDYKFTLENLMRLHQRTPPCVVYFSSGSLHLRQLTLFGMGTRLQGTILHRGALSVFIKKKFSARSWFFQIRELCLEYHIPHLLDLLESPVSAWH